MTPRTTISPRRLKSTLLLSSIALSAIILLSWTQEWFLISLGGGSTVSVAGDLAAQGLSALALAGLVLVGALSIAGRVFRWILGILQVSIGVTVVFSATLALTDPIAVSATAISELTGIAGTASVAALVSHVDQSAWGPVALIAGIVLVLDGIAIVAFSHRWPTSSKKYQTTTMSAAGSEPSGSQPSASQPNSSESISSEVGAPEHSAVDDWDALSKGDDPT